MGKTYKKTPILKSSENRDSKKIFNRKLRRSSEVELEGKGNYYKKLNNSYDICDYSQYWSEDEKAFVEKHIKLTMEVFKGRVEKHARMAYRYAHEVDNNTIWQGEEKAKWYWDNVFTEEDRRKLYRKSFWYFYYEEFMLGSSGWHKIADNHNQLVKWFNSDFSKILIFDIANEKARGIRLYKKLQVNKGR